MLLSPDELAKIKAELREALGALQAFQRSMLPKAEDARG
jgi:hypothetical protein